MEFLPMLLFVPAVGAIVCALLPATASRSWALIISILTAAIGLLLALMFNFDASSVPQYQATIFSMQLGKATTSFSLGMDAISLWLMLLTVLLMPLAIAASFESIQDRAREYYSWMLLLLMAMLGVFLARDLLIFYVFFELTLVPMFFIIGIWGGPQRRFAAGKFFLFTFAGSVFTLAGVVYLGLHAKSFDIERVITYAQTSMDPVQRLWLLIAFLAGFAVKVPLFPVHTWLPLAHTEAPTAGSVILAGVLLKLGTYGLLRFAVPIGMLGAGLDTALPGFIRALGLFCLIGIVYGALVAWVQQDIKKLVAYSSVSHLGFCVLGLLALNMWGLEGSVLYMVNHGLSTGALFLVVGMIYDRYHTRDINELSGLARRMPILAFFFVLFSLSSIGLPGLNGFVSEFLTILGAFTSEHLGMWYGSVAALGIILGAVYMLHMVARVIFGPLKTPGDHDDSADHSHGHQPAGATPGDIGAREIAILIPLAVAVVWLGVYPSLFLRSVGEPLRQMLLTSQLEPHAMIAPATPIQTPKQLSIPAPSVTALADVAPTH
jgi:NADH-quinone oxidoreductase subunit M